MKTRITIVFMIALIVEGKRRRRVFATVRDETTTMSSFVIPDSNTDSRSRATVRFSVRRGQPRPAAFWQGGRNTSTDRTAGRTTTTALNTPHARTIMILNAKLHTKCH